MTGGGSRGAAVGRIRRGGGALAVEAVLVLVLVLMLVAEEPESAVEARHPSRSPPPCSSPP